MVYLVPITNDTCESVKKIYEKFVRLLVRHGVPPITENPC